MTDSCCACTAATSPPEMSLCTFHHMASKFLISNMLTLFFFFLSVIVLKSLSLSCFLHTTSNLWPARDAEQCYHVRLEQMKSRLLCLQVPDCSFRCLTPSIVRRFKSIGFALLFRCVIWRRYKFSKNPKNVPACLFVLCHGDQPEDECQHPLVN